MQALQDDWRRTCQEEDVCPSVRREVAVPGFGEGCDLGLRARAGFARHGKGLQLAISYLCSSERLRNENRLDLPAQEVVHRRPATLAGTDIQIKPELNVWRELKFSNWSCFGFLKNAQLPIMFNPVGLAMPIPGLLDKITNSGTQCLS